MSKCKWRVLKIPHLNQFLVLKALSIDECLFKALRFRCCNDVLMRWENEALSLTVAVRSALTP